MVPRIRRGRRMMHSASLTNGAILKNNKRTLMFQLAAYLLAIVCLFPCTTCAFQHCKLASPSIATWQQRIRLPAAAAAATTTAEETTPKPSNNPRIQTTSTQIQQPSPEHDIELLSIYKSNKHLENNIVRLGRMGRTEQALQLYQAIWTLDSLKDQYRKIVQKNKSNSTPPPPTSIQLEWNNEPLSPHLTNFVTTSKLRPTTRLMNSAIDACARATRPQIHQHTAFSLYTHATSPQNADGSKKYSGALSPNVFTFGALLACCARNGDTTQSLELLQDLEEGGRFPDVALNGVIYSTVISACERAEVVDVNLALEVLNNATVVLAGRADGSGGGGTKHNNNQNAVMGVVGYNAAISTMARAMEWKMASQLLDEMIIHSTTAGLHSIDNWETSIPEEEMEPLLHVLHDERYKDLNIVVPKPDEVTFGTVLAACERSGEWEELLRIAKAAIEYGVKLDGMALTSALHACQQLGLAEDALEYLELMKQLGDEDFPITRGRQRMGAKQKLHGPDAVAYRLAISACARAPGGHRWQDGIRLLNEMRTSKYKNCAPDVVAYTAAIAGCSEAGEYTSAMQLIQTMRQEGIQPNVVTFSAVINACASASANLARKREEEDRSIAMEDVRLPMTRALKLLEAMKSPTSSIKPNIVTYNAAIRACAECLNLAGAFDLLRQLKEDGLEPTIVTYGSLMTACERMGDVEAASKVFRMVKEDDGVTTTMIFKQMKSFMERLLVVAERHVSQNVPFYSFEK
ncbi:pentatricopeptide repeat-containing protein [Skeletonema marinoi]|uniref:Pentatricopeptide repeat-containing protein n=1 Tax=Skeletonema marinoi TaxID=267567 RepID=A0AAD9D8R1_9STRA|nr:pentatricopeptide repeat-containing protein [Skeletonema marinoi]